MTDRRGVDVYICTLGFLSGRITVVANESGTYCCLPFYGLNFTVVFRGVFTVG